MGIARITLPPHSGIVSAAGFAAFASKNICGAAYFRAIVGCGNLLALAKLYGVSAEELLREVK
ncbi:MAG: hypothetical protein LUE15_05185 [Oscillospiraceae bacterium]|nr:hypothetical protein [Oscillospiraceae bacterium]